MRDLSPNPSVPPIWFEMGLGGGLATDPSVLPAAVLRRPGGIADFPTVHANHEIHMALAAVRRCHDGTWPFKDLSM